MAIHEVLAAWKSSSFPMILHSPVWTCLCKVQWIAELHWLKCSWTFQNLMRGFLDDVMQKFKVSILFFYRIAAAWPAHSNFVRIFSMPCKSFCSKYSSSLYYDLKSSFIAKNTFKGSQSTPITIFIHHWWPLWKIRPQVVQLNQNSSESRTFIRIITYSIVLVNHVPPERMVLARISRLQINKIVESNRNLEANEVQFCDFILNCFVAISRLLLEAVLVFSVCHLA